MERLRKSTAAFEVAKRAKRDGRERKEGRVTRRRDFPFCLLQLVSLLEKRFEHTGQAHPGSILSQRFQRD